MGLERVPAGRDVPHEVNVIVEIPMNSEPVKYEVDKESGSIFVDRVLTTPMRYPCNYGYIPHTLSGDGDPADVLVLIPLPLIPGSVIRVRPIGMLSMEDEAGEDTKLIAVPTVKTFSAYAHINAIDDVPEAMRDRIQHFFEHYKDLEKGKWVKVRGWEGIQAAKREIVESVERYDALAVKPGY